jgi:dihydroorotase
MRQLVVQRSMVRVLAFLHISSIGLSGWPVGESLDLDYLDVAAAVRAGRTHADLVVGVKVRMTETLTGKNGLIPLQRAVDAAQQLDVPVMVHIGGSDQALQTIVNELRPGDVITHCFTPTSNGVVRDGQLSEAARFGRAKGIAFDVGHGFGSFAFSVAEVCAESDFWPDVISTDLHGLSSNGPMVDLPTTMTKLLHLGMPLGQVVAAVTSEPARVVGRASEFGLVAVGREADLTLFELEDVPTRLADVEGQVRTASRRVTIRQTFRAGQPMNGPFQHPGVSYAQPPSVGPVVPAS